MAALQASVLCTTVQPRRTAVFGNSIPVHSLRFPVAPILQVENERLRQQLAMAQYQVRRTNYTPLAFVFVVEQVVLLLA